MIFRLHTHFCVNNSFPFSMSLRKQVRKSVKLKIEWRAPGSLYYAPRGTRSHNPCGRPRVVPGGRGDTFSAMKGCLGNSHLYTTGWYFLFCINMVCGVRPDFWIPPRVWLKSSLKCLHSQDYLSLKQARWYIRLFFLPRRHWKLLLFKKKNNQNMKLNKKQFNISYLNTKAKQSSKYFIK